jgi:hypothetical protein
MKKEVSMAARSSKGGDKKKSAKARSLAPKSLTPKQAKNVKGGFLLFKFDTVAVKTVSWSHDDDGTPSK